MVRLTGGHEKDPTGRFLTEGTCMQNLLLDIEAMRRVHEKGRTCFDQSEEWKNCRYGWHNPLFPPEYRRCCLKGEIFCPNAASDLYYFTARCYETMTGYQAPGNFELDNAWKNRIALRCVGWNPKNREAVMGMMKGCTRWQNKKRIQDAEKLLKTVFSETVLDGML